MLTVFIALLTALFLAGVFYALKGDLTRPRSALLRDRLDRFTSDAHDEIETEPDTDKAQESLLRDEVEGDLGALLSRAATMVPQLRSIELLIYRAGSPVTLNQFLLLTALLAVTGAAAAIFLLAEMRYAPPLALLGALIPLLLVRSAKRRRMDLFNTQFPEALQLFTRSLRAGHGMTMAFKMVGDELPDPVGTEFSFVAREIAFGLDSRTALSNLLERIDGSDLPFFVTAVVVQMETGGNLAEILTKLGSVIRERMLFGGKVKTLTAQSRISANILVVVPLGMAAVQYTSNAEMFSMLWTTDTGRMLAMAAIGMTVVGWLACRQIAKVDV